jgi:colanic acid biosynthesis glycosyl transferase WcaI
MRQFDIVSSISKPMLAKTRGRGVDAAKLVLFPNWVDTDAIFPMDVPSPLRAELGIPSDAIVGLFSGTLGAKQGVDVLIQAAKKVSQDRVLFLICGDGPAASKLKSMAAELSNVRFIPLQPSHRLNELLNTADFHLLPQREAVADSVLPSKLLGMLASGRPIVATVRPDSEVGRFVDNCGVLVPPGDSGRLVEAIRALALDPERRARLGAEARHRAVETLQQERILADFERELLARLNREPVSAVAESGALK